MTKTQTDILRHFRNYRVGANEMLFFNTTSANADSPTFNVAMASLIDRGLVIRERRRNAYSLTTNGYAASRGA